MADAKTFFGQMMPDALNSAFEAFEKKVAEAKATGTEKAASLQAAFDGMKSVAATMLVDIVDDAKYFYNKVDAKVSVDDEAAQEPIVTMSQSLADFDALQEAGAAPVIGGGGSGSGAARLFRPAFIDKVAGLNKVIKIVITDVPDHGDAATWVRLGNAATQEAPDTTISLSLDTYEKMTSGQIPPPAAFMQGLLKVEGDMALVMQMAQMAMGN